MANSTFPSLYFYDDKDIRDALTASKSKPSAARLVAFLRERGIVASQEWGRDALAEYVSLPPHDLAMVQQLGGLVDSPDRVEKTTSAEWPATVSLEQITSATRQVGDRRSGDRQEIYDVKVVGRSVVVDVKYSDFDMSRTRMRQRQGREARIEFDVSAGKLIVRQAASPRAKEIAQEMAAALAEVSGQEMKARSIELTGVPNARLRTKFFTNLMSSMTGFRLQTVTSVRVDRLETQGVESQESSLEEDEDTDQPEREETREEVEMLGFVNRMTLEGEGILYSSQYQALDNEGFYISRSTWASLEDASGALVEFEAGFSDPEAADFRYSVNGVFPQKGSGEHRKNKKQPTPTERLGYLRNLEIAARVALDSVLSEEGV